MYLDVKIDNILPITEVKDDLEKLVDEAANTDEMFVITRKGKPAAILVGVHHLEKLTGISHKEIMPDDDPISEISQSNPAPAATPIPEVAPDSTFLDEADKQTAAPSMASNMKDTSSAFLADEPEKPVANTDTFPNTNPFPASPAAPVTGNAPAPVADNNFFVQAQQTASTPAPVQPQVTQSQDSSSFTTPTMPAASAPAATAPAAAADDDFFSFNNTSNTTPATTTTDDSDVDDLFGPIDSPSTQPAANNVPGQIPANPPATSQTLQQ